MSLSHDDRCTGEKTSMPVVINAYRFLTWLITRLRPRLKRTDVLVIKNPSCSSCPSSKAECKRWLVMAIYQSLLFSALQSPRIRLGPEKNTYAALRPGTQRHCTNCTPHPSSQHAASGRSRVLENEPTLP